MRLIQKLLFALTLGVAASASAADAPVEGKQYRVLPNVQNTDAGKKVEVTEFFSYACPHCHAFEPALADWVRKNQNKVVFRRVHVAFSAAEQPLQRLYVTLEGMGVLEQNHAKVFDAIHVSNLRLTSDEAILGWAGGAGLDRAKLGDAYRSFGTASRVNRAKGLAEAYQIRQWPTVAIDGRFITSPQQVSSAVTPPLGEADSQQAALKVMDYLVAKALAEKK
ncbi:thiol:disulfide interchange protein DsbA/DsbL [Massilia sp. TSP1-1-2]|uniref:thiol:disulfide interchange protein DsbA/DsbL n=1 Tax=unclassified Massilia TaxID=2609279 RepID=UPI003CEE8A63